MPLCGPLQCFPIYFILESIGEEEARPSVCCYSLWQCEAIESNLSSYFISQPHPLISALP